MNTRHLLLAALCAAFMLPAQAGDDARRVAVSGQGEVSVRPDRARLSLAAEAVNLDVKAAEAQVNAVVRALVEGARKLGTREEHLSTAGVSVQPEYVWDDKLRNNRLTGYRVRRDMQLTVTDLERMGDFLLMATRAGVTQIAPPALESSRAKELSRQALARAAEDARDRARLLAETLQMRLGSVHSLRADDGGGAVPVMKVMAMRMDAAAESGNATMGIEAGEITYSARVSAEFDLLKP